MVVYFLDPGTDLMNQISTETGVQVTAPIDIVGNYNHGKYLTHSLCISKLSTGSLNSKQC